jgi:hypothetical protein
MPCTSPLVCTRRCGVVRVAIRIIVDFHPSNRPRYHRTHLNPPPTHLAGVEPAWLVSLAGVELAWMVSFAGAKPISLPSNLVRRCGIRFAIVESPSSCWNTLRRRRIRLVVTGIHFVGLESTWSASNPLGRPQIRFVVVVVVVESASSQWNPVRSRQIRFVVVELASS